MCLTNAVCGQMPQQKYIINWPAEYEPNKSKFFVHNQIEVNASPEKVWSLLVAADVWPEWYQGASSVSIKLRERYLK